MKTNPKNFIDAYRLYRNRKSLLKLFAAVRKGEYKLGFKTYLLLILTIIYTLWPADVLPDIIPLLGWVDDGALWLILIRQLQKELKRYEEQALKTEMVWVPSQKQ